MPDLFRNPLGPIKTPTVTSEWVPIFGSQEIQATSSGTWIFNGSGAPLDVNNDGAHPLPWMRISNNGSRFVPFPAQNVWIKGEGTGQIKAQQVSL